MAQKILIVDDDAPMRELLSYILRHYGFEVCEADNGADTLACIPRAHPDLVLLDLMMPHVNGFAVCSALRANPATRHLPIIVLTARADPEARALSEMAGADEYLTKPVLPVELIGAVRRILDTAGA